MAWFSELAGKAENLLNNIDRNTAAVLKKDGSHRDLEDETQLLEVMTLPSVNVKSNLDNFINNEPTNAIVNESFIGEKKTPFKLQVSTPNSPVSMNKSSLNVQSEPLTWIDVTTPNSEKNKELFEVNENKTHVVNSKMTNIKPEINCIILKDNNTMDDIKKSQKNGTIKNSNVTQVEKKTYKLNNNEEKLKDNLKQIAILQEKLNSITLEKSRFLREITDLSSTLEKTRADLKSLESELEQHRARALKTLQEKDKIIAELRNNPTSEFDDNSVLVELDQLRQERDVLREDNRQIREKLRIARQEAIDADLNTEKIRQTAMEGSIQARETIASERRKRLDVEEEVRLRSEEARSLREELNLRHSSFSSKIQKQESEITRLRAQLSTVAAPNTEVENRLSNLTRTLVVKQQELENLTLERNALRLQLERLEIERQNWRKQITFNSINDTDDVKASLPSFLMESPFDTGVARRVKRAYSTLDAAGIRIGVFLRRYPLARILVLMYMALLQFWVLIVLLSQSPEAR